MSANTVMKTHIAMHQKKNANKVHKVFPVPHSANITLSFRSGRSSPRSGSAMIE
jgi:hypothetical protein